MNPETQTTEQRDRAQSGQETVLVTGGSGYLGGWAIVELLKRGYTVRTTIRAGRRPALGSLAAVASLATITALSRRAIGRRALQLADAIAGFAPLGVGGALGIATAHDR